MCAWRSEDRLGSTVRRTRLPLELDGSVVVLVTRGIWRKRTEKIWFYARTATGTDRQHGFALDSLLTMFETVGYLFYFISLFIYFFYSKGSKCFYAHSSLWFSQTVAQSNGKAAGPNTPFPPLFFVVAQIGQLYHVDFIKRVMKCAFNRAAGIRRHVENVVKGRAQAVRVETTWCNCKLHECF